MGAKSELRRIAVAAGAAVLLVGALVFGLPLVVRADHTLAEPPTEEEYYISPDAPPESRPRPKPAPGQEWLPAGAHPATTDYAEVERLARGWSSAIGHRVGEVVPLAGTVTPSWFVAEGSDRLTTRAKRYLGFLGFTLDGAHYGLSFTIGRPAVGLPGPEWVCANSLGQCTRSAAASGELTTERWTEANGLHKIVAVTHFRQDGTVVTAYAHNWDPFVQPDQRPDQPPVPVAEPVYQPSVPLTDAQLTALATDPALTF
ncbi:hypothetical protein [Actinokineospora sp. NBRC 105648]|uniref:hypothetical protein n=1 Tax=Actinokineospora sp. NBRC 105648 TaxID=3032206 RepID=UPI0024A16734|nr:hypothetical protein [Actinokineospora sp. NBRC 105648]GLZ38999.1 hypothetical protein Acsp05_26230 [Actinokineospora sp. NBRC 105648]